VEGELQHPQLNLTPWRPDELCVFAAPDHPLRARHALSDQDLLNSRWIMREPGSGTRQTFERAMSGILPELRIELELQHTEAIKRAVEAGLGIGCLSRVTLKDAFSRGSLVELPVPHRNFQRNFYFVLHKQKYLSAGIQEWIRLCREHHH
ncbi:MAG: LysR substrate-binding domain-containing protein, partial [Ketobacteraceae bacterium]|nr:LysR substrate-binding domain-containing protein [Ketobacteraceae bacterium]